MTAFFDCVFSLDLIVAGSLYGLNLDVIIFSTVSEIHEGIKQESETNSLPNLFVPNAVKKNSFHLTLAYYCQGATKTG